jgi:hypothetical protein
MLGVLKAVRQRSAGCFGLLVFKMFRIKMQQHIFQIPAFWANLLSDLLKLPHVGVYFYLVTCVFTDGCCMIPFTHRVEIWQQIDPATP